MDKSISPLFSSFGAFENHVRAVLCREKPGEAAHLDMAPRPRRPLHKDKTSLRRAAGLLLLYPLDGKPHMLLTERSGTLPRHGGQVSLPGGTLEPSETIKAAALREAFEECGVQPDTVRVLGTLTPIQIPVSSFLLYPIVGAISERPEFRLNYGEVTRVVEASVEVLLQPGCLGRRHQTRDGIDIDVPHFDLSGIRVWGATAMIIAEFLHLLGYEPDPWT